MKKKLAFDMSSWMWNGLLGGKDTENGYIETIDGKDKYINSAGYGYENVLNRMLELMKKRRLQPIDCILVFEGKSSKSKRILINREYKGGSDKSPAMYKEFHELREMLRQTWRDLGAMCMSQDLAEADDVLAWLAHNTEVDLEVATFDNDLTVLNFTNAYGAKVSTWISEMVAFNKYGTFDYHLVTTYKALVGDSSDKIVGCPGFGEGAWNDLCAAIGYDGVQEIHDMLLASNLDPLASCSTGDKKGDRALKKIIDNAPIVLNSFDLARLRPEWVNTMRCPLTWEPGKVRAVRDDDDPRLKPYLGRVELITADNFTQMLDWALPLIEQSHEVALDIETSTPDESDEWLAAQGKVDGVDVFGSYLVGLGLTFGKNNQYTVYISVKHADTNNVDSELVRQLVTCIPQTTPIVIQHVSFELAVLFNEWGGRQLNNGFHGFLPNVLDTAIEASYVDENTPRGLKERSHAWLGYRQQTFQETVELTGAPGTLFPGGRFLRCAYEQRTVGTGMFEPLTEEEIAAGVEPYELTKTETVVDEAGEPIVATETRRYKMHELPATHVFGYGADDPICTIALHNFYKLHMQLEHHWNVYLEVEIDAAYQHAKNFIDGCDISLEKMNELSAEDDKVYDKAWAVLRDYLIKKGWEGTCPPAYTVDITAAQIKEAYQIVTGKVLDTQMRTPSKLATFAEVECDEPQFAGMLRELLAAKEKYEDGRTGSEVLPQIAWAEQRFTDYVRSFFKGEPQFNDGSPKQMQRLMYEVMGLPIRVRNKPTDTMRANGIYEGTPKTDALAINYALQECGMDEKPVLEALQLMGMVGTRRSLFYKKYPYFPHWTDGKIRSSHNQAATNTRRASEGDPNKQQWPKHPKIDGYASRFRESIVPHRPGAVIVSIDFKAQELRIMASQSRDPVMMSMYVGDNKRDQHTLTGSAIAAKQQPQYGWTYEKFEAAYKDSEHPDHKYAKKIRGLGKKLNFTAEYGAMAEKVAITLMVSVEEAQEYLDAREELFVVSGQWKKDTIEEVKEFGFVRTMMGAVRHLGPALTSSDKWKASKAERQAVNFKIQGSAAEQTKLAEGRMWKADLAYRFDAVCIGPIHDEIVWSVAIEDLYDFIPAMHACMVAPYGGMVVPIEGDISFGLDFFNQVEIGATPSREAIEDGVARMWKERAERDALKEAA